MLYTKDLVDTIDDAINLDEGTPEKALIPVVVVNAETNEESEINWFWYNEEANRFEVYIDDVNEQW